MKNILILDDDKTTACFLKHLLEKKGFVVLVESRWDVALDELTTDKYYLLLLDMVMPQQDGFDVLYHLRSNNIKIKVIILTGAGSILPSNYKEIANSIYPIEGVVQKTSSPNKLFELITNISS